MLTGLDLSSPVGVVAADPAPAANIGADILAAGGNAMDAAVATAMACCMLRPQATGIGGYVGCGLVVEGQTGQVWSIDADGTAPAAAHERMYQVIPPRRTAAWSLNAEEYDCDVADDANVHGPRSLTVPGMMAAMGIVWERWGRLPWPAIIAPSQKLLADGFPFGAMADTIARYEAVVRRYPATLAHLMPDGRLPKADDLWHRPDMAGTLARLAAAGWRDFYDGELGRTIADAVLAAGGILTRADLAGFQPRVTAPLSTTYHGATVSSVILPNGGLTALSILNLLEAVGLPESDTVEYWHRYAEVLKLGWRDRLLYLGDPDFVDVPVERLLSKEYAAGRAEHLRQFPAAVDRLEPPAEREPAKETLHLSAADRDGNLVALTITQGMAFGSFFTVPGTGIILGHGMCRLDPRPGRRNSVAPGKRPLNNTAALVVRTPDRTVALGAPGGRKIISVMPRAVQMLVDRGCSPAEAAAAPRAHTTTHEPLELQPAAGDAVVEGLRQMGHKVKRIGGICGCLNAVEFRPADRRLRAGSNVSCAAPD